MTKIKNEIEKEELKAAGKIKNFWNFLAFIFVTDKKDNSTFFWQILFFISFFINGILAAKYTKIISFIFDSIVILFKKIGGF